MERDKVSVPERALRLPDLVPMLEQRKQKRRLFFRALSSFRVEKCKFCRKRSVFHQAVMGGKALIVLGIQNKQDSEKGQFLGQHCEMDCFHRTEPTDKGPFVDPLFKHRCPPTQLGAKHPPPPLPPTLGLRERRKYEPPHDKTNKIACAPSEDSDQPGHPPSLIRVFAVRSMGSQGPKFSSCG